jgi:HAD superfamily hydrolase (TIGR01549 family)
MSIEKEPAAMRKKIFKYGAVIFDVDGTLYYQDGIRLLMIRKLLFYYFRHPSKIKDLFIIKYFRYLRENWESKNNDKNELMENKQYLMTAKKCKTTTEHVKNVIDFWIYNFPNNYLKKYQDKELYELIYKLKNKNIKIIIFSDYPTKEKLLKLGIDADLQISGSDIDVNCLKPNPKGLNLILDKLKLSPEDVLLIGDRFSKDGQAAINANMDYLILPKNKRRRQLIYKKLI